jgi:hypothetical protein
LTDQSRGKSASGDPGGCQPTQHEGVADCFRARFCLRLGPCPGERV